MTATSGELNYLGALRFSGAEAAIFLQGQVSNDTERLSAGIPLLASYNSPQGRVLSIMVLVPHSNGVIALLPRELTAVTIESMRKYVLRAKVKIEDASDDLCIAGSHGRAAIDALGFDAADVRYVESNGIGVAKLGAHDDRYWVIGGRAALRATSVCGHGNSADGFERAWRLADIRAGRPQIYAQTRELFLAQMLNLDLIDGISFSKGCYTGQEIIARTQHLGRIKRRMFRLRLPHGSWTPGQSLSLRDGRSGRIVESAVGPEGPEVLAVLTPEKTIEPQEGAQPFVDAEQLNLPYSF